MAKKTGPSYYAVCRGRRPGIYTKWDDCKAQVDGYPGAKHKKFATMKDAEAFVLELPLETHNHRASSQDSASKDAVVVYCDGACKSNGTDNCVAGIGVWWGENDPKNLGERCPGKQTNNRAELVAIARALESASLAGDLIVRSDSRYAIDCIDKWYPGWIRNNFVSSTGQPVKNVPLIRYIKTLMDIRGSNGLRVQLEHVRGHSGITGNEEADRLANCGCDLPPVAEKDWDQLRMVALGKH